MPQSNKSPPRELLHRMLREADEDKLGRMFETWWVSSLDARMRARLPPDQKDRSLFIVKGPTGNALFDRVCGLCLQGRYAEAARYTKTLFHDIVIHGFLLDEVQTGRRQNRRRARQPRPSPLRTIVAEIAKDNPKISATGLLPELDKRRGGGVIIEVSKLDNSVSWRDKKGKPQKTNFQPLEVLLSDVKKKLRLTG